MNKREVVKKRESLFLALNIILSVVAFAFLVGLATPSVNAADDASILQNFPTFTPPTATSGAASGSEVSQINQETYNEAIAQLKGEGKVEGKDYEIVKDSSGKILEVKSLTNEPISSPKSSGLLGSIFKPKTGAGGLLQGVLWAATAYGVVKWLAPKLGLSDELTGALSKGVGAGKFAGQAAYALFSPDAAAVEGKLGSIGGSITTKTGFVGKGFSWIGNNPIVFGVGVGVVVFALSYKKVQYKRVDFICDPWQAPIGGDDCEKCNDGMNPCSEYRCKSLGQACGIVNKGTEDEKCV
jgi:hypothetical protein